MEKTVLTAREAAEIMRISPSLQRKVFTPGKCARGLGGAAHHRARRAQCSAGRTYHFSGI